MPKEPKCELNLDEKMEVIKSTLNYDQQTVLALQAGDVLLEENGKTPTQVEIMEKSYTMHKAIEETARSWGMEYNTIFDMVNDYTKCDRRI